MREFVRAMVITALVAGSAKATLAGYDLLLANLDSLVTQTYNEEVFIGDDEYSTSMRDSMQEIHGNYRAIRHSSDATTRSAGIGKP
jgi:hypothetical protein